MNNLFETLDTSFNSLPSVFRGSLTLFDVPFACSGRIRSWRGLGWYFNLNTDPALFQVWRPLSPDLFRLVASLSTVRGRRIRRNSREEEMVAILDPDDPVYVQEGDIVGVYTPQESVHALLAEAYEGPSDIGTTHLITEISTPFCTLETCFEEVFNLSTKFIPRFEISLGMRNVTFNLVNFVYVCLIVVRMCPYMTLCVCLHNSGME